MQQFHSSYRRYSDGQWISCVTHRTMLRVSEDCESFFSSGCFDVHDTLIEDEDMMLHCIFVSSTTPFSQWDAMFLAMEGKSSRSKKHTDENSGVWQSEGMAKGHSAIAFTRLSSGTMWLARCQLALWQKPTFFYCERDIQNRFIVSRLWQQSILCFPS